MPLITKAGGAAAAGDFLGSNLDYYTVVVNQDIRLAANGGDAVSQGKLERVIEIVSTRGQPVIMGVPSFSNPNSTFVFAIEHVGAWTTTDLQNALTAANGTSISSATVTIAQNVA